MRYPLSCIRSLHMTTVIKTLLLTLLVVTSVVAQKGVDTQTQKIKDDAKGNTSRSTDVGRSFDWGKGKTRTRDRLQNPYRLNSRRDVLIETILGVLQEKKITVDEATSRVKDGFIVTLPYTFSKGSVVTQNELGRYGILDPYDSAWIRAQYTLTIEIQSIDGIQNNVLVNAKVEGRAGTGLTSEWRNVPSSGLAEDEFLAKLVEAVTGSSPDPSQDTDN